MVDPLSIEGWMEPIELAWLAQQASSSLLTIEVGIWKGRSTYTICKATRGRVIAIDDWQGEASHQNDYPDLEGAERSARETLKEFTDSGKLRIIKGNSKVELPKIKERPDFIFLDGGHDFKAIYNDILNSLHLLKVRTVLSGHDISYPGVNRAVRILNGWYVIPGTTIWYWRF